MSKRASRSSAATSAAREASRGENSVIGYAHLGVRSARSSRASWLTRAAFGIAIAVVIARLLMTESIRSVIHVYPGSENTPVGPGPSSGLLLDLLAGLCPLLVLLRRCIDSTYPLRFAWSAIVFLALAAWAVVSSAWAADRFAAVVSSCHLLSAAGLLWAMAQVCRTPGHTRIVAGLCAGLLGVMLAHGLWYEFAERSALKEKWEKNPEQVLATRNIEPGTFEYIQLENKILRGEVMGFSALPNTYAALLVMLGLITLGTTAQLMTTGRWIAAGVMLLLLLTTAAVLPLTQSRTGYLTAILGVILLAATIALGGVLRRRASLLYLLGVLAVLGVTAFVIGYGVSRGNLHDFHESLDFRWRYWAGSFELWKLNPLRGVGWESFGPNYLAVRLPEATEEIKDPHNFLVRFTTELGIIGGLLAIAWTALTWWTITRPAAPAGDTADVGAASAAATLLPVGRLGGAAVALAVGYFLNFLAATDLAQESGYVIFEAFRLAVYLFLTALLASFVCLRLVREGREPTLRFDAVDAPLILVGLVVALGMFFVHNLIDFAMFEVGPMFLMALLIGTAVGARSTGFQSVTSRSSNDLTPGAEPPGRLVNPKQHEGKPRGVRVARVGLAVGAAVWLIGTMTVVIPIITSEAVVAEADQSFRKKVPAVAAKGYESAFQNTIRNGDYAFRAAGAWRWAGDPPRTKAMLDLAIEANPADAGYRVARAELARSLKPPADLMAAADYAVAIKLDPNDLQTRIRYADVLEKLTLSREAAAQLSKVLELNNRLTKKEKKRLPEKQAAEIAQRIRTLRGG